MLYYDSMKQVLRDSHQRIAFVHLFEEASASVELPDEIHVVPTGKWNHPVYGEMEITSAHVAEFIQNFRDKVRKDLPITAGHDNGFNGGELRAIGWFKELIDRGVNGLFAVVEWTEEGKSLLSDKAFKYFSPEFYEEYEDPETGDRRKHVLVGGALTNRPYFKELKPVVAFSEPRVINQFNESMDLNTILAKKPEDLNDEEKAFVKQNESQLSDDQKAAFATVIEEAPAETPEEKAAREKAAIEAANIAAGLNPDGSPKIIASEHGKKITMSEAEVVALRTAADAGAKALVKIEASERKALIAELTFSQTNTAGHFYPKQGDALEKFLITLSEAQRSAFSELVGAMPKADTKLFTEIGGAGGENDGSVASIYSQIKAFADAKMLASGGKLSFSDAIKQVYTEKPELKKSYETAIAQEA